MQYSNNNVKYCIGDISILMCLLPLHAPVYLYLDKQLNLVLSELKCKYEFDKLFLIFDYHWRINVFKFWCDKKLINTYNRS